MRYGLIFLRGLFVLAVFTASFQACRKPIGQLPEDKEKLSKAFMEDYKGFYVLNNGGEGSNKATLDYYDAEKGEYQRNIYAQQNPQNPAMGDDATDMAYFNGFLYVALRGSHKVVKLDPKGKLLGEVRVNECEKLLFYNGKGYVTSLRNENVPRDQPPYGEVICFDPEKLEITGRVTVGCQPSAMVVGGKDENLLYISNSGRQRVEGYDNTVSIVDPESLQVVDTYKVGLNPSCLAIDNQGYYLITLSLGDYGAVPSSVRKIQLSDGKPGTGKKENKTLEKQLSNPLELIGRGSNIYCLTVEKVKESGWNGAPKLLSFGAYFLGKIQEVLPGNAMAEIQNATGFAAHPEEKAFYVFDARNFTSSGTVYCFSREGKKLEWKVRAGIKPIDVEFVKE